MTLTRDEILAKRMELPKETVEIPELGGSVTIRTLTLKEVREIQKLQKSNGEPLSIYPRLVAMACVDEAGRQLFVGEDIRLIDEFAWPVTDALAKAVLKLNKMIGEETEGSENGVPKG
jgi:hypothetical protein